ncbi:UNKNOWN [Stylonychia lemnae]|uniref:Uncharacterized protein n=1 Tax=Stylonychia lemnae TaxID=5949 RepID=A0A077ZSS2_STYLE|nr:UNKNOWN [Stylonychia lemnae]|eukprot:CDW72927.1 UNKNOWN [Stylonychia lemnae]
MLMDSNLITYGTNTKPNLTYVTTTSQQYKDFIRRVEFNYINQQNKLYACTYCWAFLTIFQKKRHLEHATFFVSPSHFKDEMTYLSLCKLNNKFLEMGKGANRLIRVPLFNEQALNVDQTTFGQPTEIPNQPQPRFVHQCLVKKGGAITSDIDNPHTSENSGIPTEKLKNASLQQMLRRIMIQNKDQQLINQKLSLEVQLLKQDNQDLRNKVFNLESVMVTVIQRLLQQNTHINNQGQLQQDLQWDDILEQLVGDRIEQQNQNDRQQNLAINDQEVLALQSEEQSLADQQRRFQENEVIENNQEKKIVSLSTIEMNLENTWIALNNDDSPISEL